MPQSGCLERWAKQGVLLLNTVLTVEAHQAHSHKNIGWETFTDHVIQQLSEHKDHVVFSTRLILLKYLEEFTKYTGDEIFEQRKEKFLSIGKQKTFMSFSKEQ